MTRPPRSFPRPLADFVRASLGDVFARQGFASGDLVTHWADIVGSDIARLAEPIKLQWPRSGPDREPELAVLHLRVEGPAAIEIQHLSPVILERVNRFLGWRAVARLALRQAPLRRSIRQPRPQPPTASEVSTVAASLPAVSDAGLREALARLGASVRKR